MLPMERMIEEQSRLLFYSLLVSNLIRYVFSNATLFLPSEGADWSSCPEAKYHGSSGMPTFLQLTCQRSLIRTGARESYFLMRLSLSQAFVLGSQTVGYGSERRLPRRAKLAEIGLASLPTQSERNRFLHYVLVHSYEYNECFNAITASKSHRAAEAS